MSNDKILEQFEAAIVKMHTDTGVQECDALVFLEKGINGYLSVSTKAAWWAWQASRAAIEVELPEQRNVPDRDCWARTNALGYNTANHECRTAIESLGLKVKP